MKRIIVGTATFKTGLTEIEEGAKKVASDNAIYEIAQTVSKGALGVIKDYKHVDGVSELVDILTRTTVDESKDPAALQAEIDTALIRVGRAMEASGLQNSDLSNALQTFAITDKILAVVKKHTIAGPKLGNFGDGSEEGNYFGDEDGTGGDGEGAGGEGGNGEGGPGGGGSSSDSAAEEESNAGQMPVTPEPIIPATVVPEPASDTEDASAYIDNILDEPAINSISKNPHYLSLPFRHESEPLPEWSFSVDFVPISSYFDNARLADMFTILTKAVISVTINELKANTGKLMYAGLQHPFVTNMNTASDLHIKFAENETFTISSILREIYRWCSHDQEFAVYDLSVTHSDDQTEPIGLPYTRNTNPIFDKFVCDIVVNVYPPEIAHAFNNSDEILHPAFIYTYKNCWLKSVAQLALDYDSDEMIDRDAVFTYQYVLSEDWASYVDRTHLNSDTSEAADAAVQTPEQEPSTWEKFKSAISFEDPYLERGADKSATEKAKGFISPFGDVIGAVGNVFTGEN